MNQDIVEGHCLCGHIHFQIKGTPLWIGYCHCESCRRNTGAVVATFLGVSDQAIQFTSGQRSFYESSPGVRRGFCATCGTPLTYEADQFPNEVHFYISTINTPERFLPQFHVHYAERIPWLEINDDLPKYLKNSHGELA